MTGLSVSRRFWVSGPGYMLGVPRVKVRAGRVVLLNWLEDWYAVGQANRD